MMYTSPDLSLAVPENIILVFLLQITKESNTFYNFLMCNSDFDYLEEEYGHTSYM